MLRREDVGSWTGYLGFGIPWTGGSFCLLRVFESSMAQRGRPPCAFASGRTTLKAEIRRRCGGFCAVLRAVSESLRDFARVVWVGPPKRKGTGSRITSRRGDDAVRTCCAILGGVLLRGVD